MNSPSAGQGRRMIAQVATVEVFALGEAPVWDPRRGVLWWVDITSGVVCRGGVREDGSVLVEEKLELPAPVGAVAPGSGGDLVLALGGAVVRRDEDGTLRPLTAVVPAEQVGPPAFRRINDGAVDPRGRFLVGTLHEGSSPDHELLVRIEPDGSVTTIDRDLGLSNGIAWSVDGTVMYSVDTQRRIVYRRSYDPIGTRAVHLEFVHAHPDGICIDAEDHLWVAMWGLGQVHRYGPDGALAAVIDVPAPHTSSVAFAGRDLETLVITTARDELTDQQLAEWPNSGRIFTIRPGVRGWPGTPWSGMHARAESKGQS